jgi:hypothetical protein
MHTYIYTYKYLKRQSFRFYIDSQDWENCLNTHSKVIKCSSGKFNYFLRVLVKNEGLRATAENEVISLAIEGNISLVSVYSTPTIKSSNVLDDDLKNITESFSIKSTESQF